MQDTAYPKTNDALRWIIKKALFSGGEEGFLRSFSDKKSE
jgi:hypothetical protein